MPSSRVCAALLALAASCEAFSPSFTAAPPRHAGRGAACAVERLGGLLALSSQLGLSKMEDKAVERMCTKEFEKLCKTCPTRLQPRADTAAAMLLALPAEERQAALQRVEGVLLGAAEAPLAAEETCGREMGGGMAPKMMTLGDAPLMVGGMQQPMKKEKEMKDKMKMEGGMEKMKMKDGDKERMKAEKKEAEKMRDLEVSSALLALVDSLDAASEPGPWGEGAEGRFGKITAEVAMMIEKEVRKQRMELEGMSPPRRAVRRLKYLEKQAKYERKLAECRLTLVELPALCPA